MKLIKAGLPLAIRYDGTSPSGGHAKQHPALPFNYLSSTTDRQERIGPLRCARKILNQLPPSDAGFCRHGR
jgi:choline dehydrogenase